LRNAKENQPTGKEDTTKVQTSPTKEKKTMIAETSSCFAPRTIATARTERARHASVILRVFAHMIGQRLAAARRAWRHHRELAALVDADPRILADIGLTRGEVRAIALSARWRQSTRETIATLIASRIESRSALLRRIASPSLAPSGSERAAVRRDRLRGLADQCRSPHGAPAVLQQTTSKAGA
jgi:uncharacterized protein YjiS (DUF1127 family)